MSRSMSWRTQAMPCRNSIGGSPVPRSSCARCTVVTGRTRQRSSCAGCGELRPEVHEEQALSRAGVVDGRLEAVELLAGEAVAVAVLEPVHGAAPADGAVLRA